MKGVYLKKGNTKVSVVPYYRVGDLFLTTIATNPSNFLGGTWELFGPGRCLVCVNTSDSDFNTVKKTGGAKTKTTGNHTLTVNEIPSHNHEGVYEYFSKKQISNRGDGGGGWNSINISGITGSQNNSYSFLYTGHSVGSQAHNHGNLNVLQPYITCYVWIRTA